MTEERTEYNAAKKRRLKRFPELSADDFMHPWDTQAIKALQKIPGFEFLVAKLMKYGWEKILRLINLSCNLRVNQTMVKQMDDYLKYACRILGVEIPVMYISTDPRPNAYTYGHTSPFVVVTSGLIELLNDEELFFVIAHEVGHIKCGHVLYRTMARHFSEILQIAGRATLGLGNILGTGLQLALFDWARKSELSADRAALIAVQDRHVANSVLMKLAGGALRLKNEYSESEFLRQVRDYEEAGDESMLNKIYQFIITASETHPFIVMRAKHLDRWINDGGYEKLTGIKLDEKDTEDTQARKLIRECTSPDYPTRSLHKRSKRKTNEFRSRIAVRRLRKTNPY